MEQQEPQGLNIAHIADLIYQRKIFICLCILLCISVGLAFYLKQPKIYESTALLSYQQAKINPAQMSPDEQERIKDIVSTLSQVITSRTNLEKIITGEALYKEELAKLPMEDVVEIMRKHIIIKPSKDGDTFSVSYEATIAEKVSKVTNTLASGFIEENMKYREEKASETSAYTQDELNMAKAILDKKEAVMRDYKLKYYNEMPEQRAINMSRLASLQAQEQSKQESIQELKKTRVLVREQIGIRRQIISELNINTAQTALDNRPVPLETNRGKLIRLQNELQRLQLKYTAQHPKVKSLLKKIDQLEQIIASEPDQSTGAAGEKSAPVLDNTLVDLQMEIKSIELSIAKIEKEIELIHAQSKQYEEWINAAPVREAEWSALTREYGELKRHYDFLVSQNLQAGSALNLERKQKGSQFKIIDAARPPIKPVKPDFLKIMGLAFLFGCGIGGGITLGLDLIDTSFKNQDKLAKTFGLEVICSVPNLPLKNEIIKKRLWAIVKTLFVLLWAAAFLMAMFYFWKQGQIIIFSLK